MKYNRLIAIGGVAFCFFGSNVSVSAARLNVRDAGKIATSFVASHASKYMKKPTAVLPTPAYAPVFKGENLLYVFNNPDNAGFTIVSGDDELPTVIGYTTSGAFDYDALPPSMKWWLDGMEKEIAHYYKGKTPARIIKQIEEHDPVATLMKTTWNQDAPYNDLCPMDGDYRSYTGCVATAMAQVIKYHAWPPNGRGEAKGINFSEYTYDYNLMLNAYNSEATPEQCNAVATLMLHAGYACDMMYSARGSGATDGSMHRALIENFRYNPGTKLNFRDYMTAAEWDEIIYGEVSASRPVLMTGQAIGGGHCFVVDGYEGKGYYHLNWGWGGYQDGYFLLYLLNPDSGGAGSFDGGYNSNQTAVSMMWPEGIDDTPVQTGLRASSGMRFDEATQSLDFYGDVIYNPYGNTMKGVLGVLFVSVSDPTVTGEALSEYFEGLETYYGWKGITIEEMPDLPDGLYKLYPFTRDDSTGELVTAIFPNGSQPYAVAQLKDGELHSVGATELGSKHILGYFDVSGKPYEGGVAMVSAEIINVDDMDSEEEVILTVRDSNGEEIDRITTPVRVKGHSSVKKALWGSSLLKEGDYTYTVSGTHSGFSESKKVSVGPANGHSFDPSGVHVNAVEKQTFDVNEELNVVFNITNPTSKAVYVISEITLYDKDLNQLQSFKKGSQRIGSNKSVSLKCKLDPVPARPDKYYLVIGFDGKDISPLIPYSVTEYQEIPGELAYTVIDTETQTIRLSEPANGTYAETVAIPEKINDTYSLTALEGDALTFANDIEHLVLPSTIERIGSGALYHTALESITFKSDKAPVLMPDIMKFEDAAQTHIYLPAGTANTYGRTSGWEQMDLPNWTFFVADGITVQGLDKGSDGNILAPYFVDSDDTLAITVSGQSRQIYAHLIYPDGKTETIEVQNGSLTIPALAHGKAACEISYDPAAGIESITAAENADIYTLNGVLVKRAATADDINRLPKGIYVAGGKKFIR